MEKNLRNEEIDTYEQEFIELIKKSLGIKIGNFVSGTISSKLGDPIFINASILENIYLKNTEYLSNAKKIIHFTSLQALCSIIKEGHLRIYNLNNSDDENEYKYAVEFFKDFYRLQGVTEETFASDINKIKENTFILSCTNIDERENKMFWEKYANKKQGVAIEFEILNEQEKWEFFYFTNVKYNKLNMFSQLEKRWLEIQKKYPQNTFRINLDPLLGFHKSNCWKDEKEVRLLYTPNASWHNFANYIYQDFKQNNTNREIKYLKLSLCNDDHNFLDKSLNDSECIRYKYFPKIKISNIYFGEDFPFKNEDFVSFAIYLRDYVSEKMGFRLPDLRNNKMTIPN